MPTVCRGQAQSWPWGREGLNGWQGGIGENPQLDLFYGLAWCAFTVIGVAVVLPVAGLADWLAEEQGYLGKLLRAVLVMLAVLGGINAIATVILYIEFSYRR